MKTPILVLVVLIVLSCSRKADTPNSTDVTGRNTSEDSVKTLYKKEALHHFSSTVDEDSFKIALTGRSIKDGQVKFQIIRSNGEILFYETFPALALLDFGFTGKVDDPAAEEYIKARIDSFFVEERFHQPAIPASHAFDENYSKKEIWDDIISDQTAIGFHYLLGKEDGRRIAYSKKLGKVVLYYNCC